MAYYATYIPNELGEMQKVVINAGVGFVLPYYGETAPPGTLACDGSEISRAAYDELFAVLGTKAGAGDGSTTFNLPDLRGRFIRGIGGNAAALGTGQDDAIRNITGSIPRLLGRGGGPVNNSLYEQETIQGGAAAGEYSVGYTITVGLDASREVPTAVEVRPVNVALLWCIIYE